MTPQLPTSDDRDLEAKSENDKVQVERRKEDFTEGSIDPTKKDGEATIN